MDEPVVIGIAVLIGVLVAVIGVMRVPDITITSFGILTLIAVALLVWPNGEFVGAVALVLVGVTLLALAALVQTLRDLTACYALIQSIAAARQRTPMKLEAVFSYRVAIARHSFRRAQRRSTMLRLL